MIAIAQQPAAHSDVLGTSLGVAAILLVLGWTITRWQRDRERFALMRTALERGVTRFPGTPPYWLVSLRQGVTLAAIGIGLAIVGGSAWWLARGVPMPVAVSESAQPVAPHSSPDERDMDRPPPPQFPPPFDPDGPRGRGGPPPHDDGPFGGPPGADRLSRGDRLHGDGPRVEHRAEQFRLQPLTRDPERDRWNRAEAQQTMGLVSAATGLILLLVGVVRIGFAKVEQRFAAESEDTAAY